jgi:hypothetical protein
VRILLPPAPAGSRLRRLPAAHVGRPLSGVMLRPLQRQLPSLHPPRRDRDLMVAYPPLKSSDPFQGSPYASPERHFPSLQTPRQMCDLTVAYPPLKSSDPFPGSGHGPLGTPTIAPPANAGVATASLTHRSNPATPFHLSCRSPTRDPEHKTEPSGLDKPRHESRNCDLRRWVLLGS